jgi:hypothetical protein
MGKRLMILDHEDACLFYSIVICALVIVIITQLGLLNAQDAHVCRLYVINASRTNYEHDKKCSHAVPIVSYHQYIDMIADSKRGCCSCRNWSGCTARSLPADQQGGYIPRYKVRTSFQVPHPNVNYDTLSLNPTGVCPKFNCSYSGYIY